MKRKVAFVAQRYGLNVNGGAELHCRQLAEHLTSVYEVEVLTTKAIDYITWADEYKNDIDIVNGVTVRRFGVKHIRNIKKFNKLSEKVLGVKHDDALEEKWIEEQGPLCEDLITYIIDHKDEYDVFVFMTYMYYTTFKGVQEVAEKAVLIPTAHNELPIYLRCYDKVFKNVKGIFYNTVEEKEFVERRFSNSNVINNEGFGGVGVEIPEHVDANSFKERQHLSNYMVYVGRIDKSKGCEMLFKGFERYKKNNKNNLKLVLMGKAVMDIPKHKDILNLGFVSDTEKFDIMAGADFLIMPSQFESLSMAALESLALSVPIVVNGMCDVLKGHCVKSNAGLYYKTYYEFEGCLNYMLEHEEDRQCMGKNGVKYVAENYQWNVITEHFVKMVDEVCKSKGEKL